MDGVTVQVAYRPSLLSLDESVWPNDKALRGSVWPSGKALG